MKKMHWLAAMALMYTVSAFGEQWVGTTTVDSTKISVDKDRFERRGTAVTAYIQFLFDKPKTMPFTNAVHDRAEHLYFFQCKEKKMVFQSYVLKNGNETTFTQKTTSLDGKPSVQPVPDSGLEAAAFKLACSYKPKP